ncbi:MAG: copper amine oxidase N-terminal domain-containing protein [Desulfotomaculales bacterium]
MKRWFFILLTVLFVVSAVLAPPVLAKEKGQAAENEMEAVDDVLVDFTEDISELEDELPADDLVSSGQDPADPSGAEESVNRAVYLAEEIWREMPAAAKLHAAVRKLKETRAWDAGHLVALSRELYRFTWTHRVYLNNHHAVKRAVVLLTDETVRLAHRFVRNEGVKLAVYKNAAATYTALGCYKRAAAVTELILKLTPNRKAVYGDLKKMYGKAGARDLKVFVRGKRPNFDVRPVIANGRTLVPIRAISESLGAKVDYDPGEQKVFINNGTINVNLYLNDRNALVNGRRVVLDEPARVINGRTMVPLRFVSESLGAAVDYDPQTQMITIE